MVKSKGKQPATRAVKVAQGEITVPSNPVWVEITGVAKPEFAACIESVITITNANTNAVAALLTNATALAKSFVSPEVIADLNREITALKNRDKNLALEQEGLQKEIDRLAKGDK